MPPSDHGAERLARRLRALRERNWDDGGLTQAQLAEAFSSERALKASMISTWESPTNPKSPNRDRLRAYARFFATRRSLEGEPHLISEDDLDDAELEIFKALETELLSLLAGETARPLKFTDGPVTIICPDAPEDTRSPLADEDHPDFTKLLQYADLDALVELHGHVRAANPTLDVYHRLASEVRADDLSAHVILIGGITWSPTLRRIQTAITEVPITQRATPGESFDPFVIRGDEDSQVIEPVWEGDGADQVLVEDVAYLARIPNPFNSSRTLTICNGIQSRGVLGAVRCLTDARVRTANEDYLASRFSTGSFALLLRVPVVGGEAISPDLKQSINRLYEWPLSDGGRT